MTDDKAAYDAAVALLRGAGYRITEPPPPPPVDRCHWCGKTDNENEEDGFGPLIDITVVTSEGEEGYARERRYGCQEHSSSVLPQLIELGFGSHRHGGINYLEDHRCPGYDAMDACPTPDDPDA